MAQNTYTAKKSGKGLKVLGIIAGILVAALLLGLCVYSKLGDSGFFLRHTVAVKSENFEVNNAMMSYFFSTNYSSAMSSNSSTYTNYMGLDTSSSLKSQQYPGGGTWYDYFMQSVTLPSVKQLLTLAEAAKAAGYELSDEDKASIDEALSTLETTAKNAGYSTSYYIMNYYGVGLNIDDVRDAMELSQYAYSYYNHLVDSYSFTEEDWTNHYNENTLSFQKIDYLKYTFDATNYETEEAEEADTDVTTEASTDVTTEASTEATTEAVTEAVTEAATEATTEAVTDATTDEATDTTAVEEENENAEIIAIATAYASELAECKDAESFTAYVEKHLTDVVYASTEDETEKLSSIQEDLEGLESKAVAYEEGDTINNTLFTMKNGEVFTENNDTKITVYLITAEAYREDYTTKDARVIVLSNSDGDVTATLDEINSEFTSGMTDEKFEELYTEYSLDSSAAATGGLYENIGKDSFGVDELDAWLYDDARQAGDHDIFTHSTSSDSTSTDSTVYYYVVSYVGDGDIKWQTDVNSALVEAKYSEDYEGFEESYGGDKITVDLVELYKIPAN